MKKELANSYYSDKIFLNVYYEMERQMEGIVDIHNHILYGLDDGARSIRNSMELIEEEYNQGVRKIVFTPHYWTGVYERDRETIKKKYDKLQIEVHKKYPNLELYLGNEILYTGDVVELIKKDKVFTIAASSYVLVEFAPEVNYHLLEKRLKILLVEGYKPILAHCERYKCLQKDIIRVRHLVEAGVYMQVNAKSVYSLKFRGFTKRLIDGDCLHFIATDAHDRKARGVCFDKCVSYLNKKYSDEYVKWLLIDNPNKVLSDRYI